MSKAPPTSTTGPTRRIPPVLGDAFAPWFACGAVVAALALLMARPPLTIHLTVDGNAQTVSTQAGTVADLLSLAGVPVRDGDHVMPSPEMRLTEGMQVRLQRARQVRVRADGRTIRHASHGHSALAVLGEVGVHLNALDVVAINGQPWPVNHRPMSGQAVVQMAGGPGRTVPLPDEAAQEEALASGPAPGESSWLIEVHRAVPIIVVEDGVALRVMVAGATLGQALASAGLALGEGDSSSPSPETPVREDMRVDLVRGLPLTVFVDGKEHEVRVNAATVGEALTKTGLAIGPLDRSDPPPDAALVRDMRVHVVRVAEETVVREVPIPFARREEPDPAANLDTVTLRQAGVPGLARRELRLRHEDGRVVSEEVLNESILHQPVDEVVTYGTNVIWRNIETEQGPKRYWRHLRAYATSYSLSRAGTPKTAPWYGRTRMGLPMGKGIIAVDPKVIPLGMWLYVPGYGVGIAGDTGGGVKGYHVDLGFDDDNYESWHWPVDVYVLDRLPPEHQMRWILPPARSGLGAR